MNTNVPETNNIMTHIKRMETEVERDEQKRRKLTRLWRRKRTTTTIRTTIATIRRSGSKNRE